MQLLIMAGEHARNRSWAYRAWGQLGVEFDTICVQNYAHWDSDAPQMDLTQEVTRFEQRIPDLDDETAVLAKSMGSLLTARAIDRGMFMPKWMLFCGLPLNIIPTESPGFAYIISHANIPTTVIQNEHDPLGSADYVKQYLNPVFQDRRDFGIATAPGDTHEYNDFDFIRRHLIRMRDTR